MEKDSRERPRGLPGISACLLAISLIGASGAWAQDAGRPDRLALRGFGSLAVTTQQSGDVGYRRFVGQPDGVREGDLELHTDSIAGAQLDARLGRDVTASVQGVVRLRADGDWDPAVSQAYLRYSPDESWVLRAGRLGYDIYLLAESRQVGYSYLAMRPSPEVYGLLGNDEFDGADVMYTRRVGNGLLRARAFGGNATNEVASTSGHFSETRARIRGAVLDYLQRGWTARAAMVEFSYDPDPSFQTLAAALRMTGMPTAMRIAEGIAQRELTSTGLQISVVYEDGPLQSQVQYSKILSDSISGPDVETAFAQVGYRVGQWTPFIAYANSRDRHPIRDSGLPDLPMFAPLDGAVTQIQKSLRSTQHTTSLGVRYDLSSHLDFKLQLDRVVAADSALMLDRRNPPGGPFDMTVIAAGVDFVF